MSAPRPVLGFAPRGLRPVQAAAYVGVGETKFRKMVHDGLMPKPRKIGTSTVWDRQELDNYFENLPRDGDDQEDWGEDVAV